MNIHRFSVPVYCNNPEEIYEDMGFIIFPDSYSETEESTRLIINCHGAGGTVSTDDSQVEHQALTHYLVANGYAVMDVNGLPVKYAEENNIDIRNNIGSPIAVRSYVKAYHYCIEKFNLKREVFVHGSSMGGISSTNLVLSGQIPVIAHSAFCPVLDTYNEIFLHPWSDGLPKFALGKIYDLDIDKSGEYIYDKNKIGKYNPAANPESISYPVPLKFWHCADDETVSYEVTKKFIDRIKKNNGNAVLRTFPTGGHEPQLVGEYLQNPSGNNILEGVLVQITIAVEEVYIWIKNNGG